MDDKKRIEALQKVFAETDAWFTRFGEVSLAAHVELKKMLEKSVKGVKKVEYYLDIDDQKVEIVLFLGFWKTFFGKPKKISTNVLELLKECLPDYDISVEIRKYKESK